MAENSDESMDGAEQGEDFVADAETSQVEGGEEGETDENSITYGTEAAEDDAAGTTVADIFGDDDDEVAEETEEVAEPYFRPQQVIGSPLRLVTNPLPTAPEDTLV